MAKLPATLLVHTATLVRNVEGGDLEEWVEGEPGDAPAPEDVSTIPCVLFLPTAGEVAAGPTSGWKPRVITRPTLLFDPARVVGIGDFAATQPGKDDELRIVAPELAPWTNGSPARWQVDGIPQPAGKPGSPPVVVIATLKQLVD